MKHSLADRRAMVKAMMGTDGQFEWLKGGSHSQGCVDAQMVTERYDVQDGNGQIVSTLKRRLCVVEEDVAAAVGDLFTRDGKTWKVGGITDEDTGLLELDLKKV